MRERRGCPKKTGPLASLRNRKTGKSRFLTRMPVYDEDDDGGEQWAPLYRAPRVNSATAKARHRFAFTVYGYGRVYPRDENVRPSLLMFFVNSRFILEYTDIQRNGSHGCENALSSKVKRKRKVAQAGSADLLIGWFFSVFLSRVHESCDKHQMYFLDQRKIRQ